MSSRKKGVVGRLLEKVVAGFALAEKKEKKMSKKIIGGLIAVLVVVVLGSRVAFAASHTADVDIYVTPGITLSLTATTSFYYFGVVDYGTNAEATTAVVLDNDSTVSVSIVKEITGVGTNWTAAVDGGAAYNTYVLYAATSTVALVDADFGVNNDFGALNNSTDLTNGDGTTQTELGADGEADQTCDVYFRIVMPLTGDNQDQRRIDVQFTAAGL